MVAVVNYRSHEHVASLLKSLRAQPPDNLVVLENDSGVAEWQALKDVVSGYPFAKAILSKRNLGFGAGANAAVQALEPSDEDLIWILNPDVEVPAGTTETLARVLRNGLADAVSPMILTGQRTEPMIWFAGGDVLLRTGRTQHRCWGESLDAAPLGDLAQCSFLTGAAPMFTGRAWRLLQGFREDLFLYWEDADLSLRAADLGLRLAVVPPATIWHGQGGSSDHEGHSPAYYFYMQRNRLVVLGLHGIHWTRLVGGPGAIETMRLALRSLKEPDHRIEKFLAAVRGLRAGVRLQARASMERRRRESPSALP